MSLVSKEKNSPSLTQLYKTLEQKSSQSHELPEELACTAIAAAKIVILCAPLWESERVTARIQVEGNTLHSQSKGWLDHV